jgi:hypothetical protein
VRPADGHDPQAVRSPTGDHPHIRHRSTESTLRYIHLSGRDLATKLNRSMTQLHAQRVAMLTEDAGTTA